MIPPQLLTPRLRFHFIQSTRRSWVWIHLARTWHTIPAWRWRGPQQEKNVLSTKLQPFRGYLRVEELPKTSSSRHCNYIYQTRMPRYVQCIHNSVSHTLVPGIPLSNSLEQHFTYHILHTRPRKNLKLSQGSSTPTMVHQGHISIPYPSLNCLLLSTSTSSVSMLFAGPPGRCYYLGIEDNTVIV